MAGSAAADTRYRYYNRRFERALPGMDLLLDAFAVVDCGMAQAIAHRGQKPACGAGCYHCCTQPIPLTPLEILGLRIFMGPELVSGHAAAPAVRHEQQGMAPASCSGTGGASSCMSAATDHVLGLAADVRQQLAARLAAFGGKTENLGATCPFLHEGRCAVYPVRPMACRRYIVYGVPCAQGEDPTCTRPHQVLQPGQDFLQAALRHTLPWYRGRYPLPDQPSADETQAFFRSVTTVLQAVPWARYV